ncbi:IS3 family transposase [Snodgrassella sp. ESL0253]|uniref:IS3 family transposase n=1 Tax=Snodgrassella sp. ESL0253 TaxID=2705031 RepID=UPI00351B876E
MVVFEATIKNIKAELVKGEKFMVSGELQQPFAAYAYCYNHKQLYSLLGYLPSMEFNKWLALNFGV